MMLDFIDLRSTLTHLTLTTLAARHFHPPPLPRAPRLVL